MNSQNWNVNDGLYFMYRKYIFRYYIDRIYICVHLCIYIIHVYICVYTHIYLYKYTPPNDPERINQE